MCVRLCVCMCVLERGTERTLIGKRESVILDFFKVFALIMFVNFYVLVSNGCFQRGSKVYKAVRTKCIMYTRCLF